MRNLYLIALSLLAAACTPMMMPQQQNTSFNCNPQAIQQARYIVVNTARVPLGGHKIQVVGTIGSPQKMESFALQDGSMVEVLFYRTGEPGCAGMPTEDRFTPFVFQNTQLIGYGNDYYRSFILPSLKHNATPYMQQQTQQPQGQHAAPNARGAVGSGQPLWQ